MSKKSPKKFKQIKTDLKDRASKAVIDTLKYKAIFNYPTTYFELWHYLLSKEKISVESFNETLQRLVKTGKIRKQKSFYYLTEIDLGKSKENRERAEEYRLKAFSISNILKKIPWIDMIALTGSVAANNAASSSDIDMFFIVKPRRLWITRMFCVYILKILGVYWRKDKPEGKICPNIYVSNTNLSWDKRNIYIANEIAMIYPLYSRNNSYFRFISENSWIETFLPNILICKPPESIGIGKRNVLTKILDKLEFLLMKIQTSHMKGKVTKEVLKHNLIHFNKNDISNKILLRY